MDGSDVSLYQNLDRRSDRFLLHTLEAFACEREQQEFSSGNFIDAAGTQVKKGILVDLANGGAVRAFHIVGKYLKLWLGVDLRIVREKQVAVCLLRVRLLRVLVNDNAAMKDAVRPVGQNAVVKLPAAAIRSGMLYKHVVIEVLLEAAHEEAVDQTLSPWAP